MLSVYIEDKYSDEACLDINMKTSIYIFECTQCKSNDILVVPALPLHKSIRKIIHIDVFIFLIFRHFDGYEILANITGKTKPPARCQPLSQQRQQRQLL